MKHITLFYTFEEKVAYLNRLGYEVEKKTIYIPSSRHGNYSEDEPHISYRVYLNGEDQMIWAEKGGSYCVDWMFERELSRRLLLV